MIYNKTLKYSKQQGIVLRTTEASSVLLFDQTEGKIFVNLSQTPEKVFPGAIAYYSLVTKYHKNYFQIGSYTLFSQAQGYSYQTLQWLHELLSLADNYLPLQSPCQQSFSVLLLLSKIISKKIPPEHLEVLECGSIAKFLLTLGFVEEFFLQEFVELFDLYCKILEGDVVALNIAAATDQDMVVLDLKIKSLEKKLPHAKHLINKVKRSF